METVAEAGSVPDAVAPPPQHPRFSLIDGMRAIAVMAVVVVHVSVFATPTSEIAQRLLLHLNIGVTIFFLISGFLLYRPFIANRAGGGPAPAVDIYAKRRFLRIFPAYWLVLAVLTVLPGVTGIAGGSWLAHVTLLQTLPGLGADSSCVTAISDCGLAQTWSLVVEVSFYAALPLYVLLAGRLAAGRTPRQWVPVELGLLAVLSTISLVLHFALFPDGSSIVGATALGFGLWFALGMGLAVISVGERGGVVPVEALLAGVRRHPTALWVAAALLYLILIAVVPATPFLLATSDQLLVHLGFAAIALLLMLPAVFGDGVQGLPQRILRLPLVAWLGLISYGIFLWHYVFAIELGSPGEGYSWLLLLTVTLAGTIPIAAASYYLLERPLLRFKYRRGDRE